MRYIFKILISTFIIISISEVAKRSSLFAALIASLPLTSILAMVWLYSDTSDIEKVTELSYGIFWMALPSIVFFLSFPLFARRGYGFGVSMTLSCFSMIVGYTLYLKVLVRLGIQL